MIKTKFISTLSLAFLMFCSCESFLDERPSSSMALASSVRDYQALMDYQIRMNDNYPEAGDVAAGDFYLEESDWSSRADFARDMYTWDANSDASRDWVSFYQRIFYANVVVEGASDAELAGLTEADRESALGSAHFVRGLNFFLIAQLFAPAYDANDLDNPFGIPLRMTADINAKTRRSTMGETFRQIEKDLQLAASLLPDRPLFVSRPSKAAAYAALSRLYLYMGRYEEANGAADLSIAIQPELMDYNEIPPDQRYSFEQLNPEVIFIARLGSRAGMLGANYAKVVPELFDEYHLSDLRRELFFEELPDGSHVFKGSYYGSSWIFSGLATDEVYLTKAEALARLGEWEAGLETLEILLEKRYLTDVNPIPAGLNEESALSFILNERRKQLVFRGGIRWGDLKRLNKEPRFAMTLTRTLGSNTFELPPQDPRYVFLIPHVVVDQSGIEQNVR